MHRKSGGSDAKRNGAYEIIRMSSPPYVLVFQEPAHPSVIGYLPATEEEA